MQLKLKLLELVKIARSHYIILGCKLKEESSGQFKASSAEPLCQNPSTQTSWRELRLTGPERPAGRLVKLKRSQNGDKRGETS